MQQKTTNGDKQSRLKIFIALLVLVLVGSIGKTLYSTFVESSTNSDKASSSGGLSLLFNEQSSIHDAVHLKQIYADYVMEKFSGVHQLSGKGVSINFMEGSVRCDHQELMGKVTSGCLPQNSVSTSQCNHSTAGVGKIVSEGLDPASTGIAPKATIKAGGCYDLSEDDAFCSSAVVRIGGGLKIWKGLSKCPSDAVLQDGIDHVRYHHDIYNGRYDADVDRFLHSNPYYGFVQSAGNGSGNAVDPKDSSFPLASEVANGHYHLGCDEVFTDSHLPTKDEPFDALTINAASKNVISVGSAVVLRERYTSPADVLTSGRSSRGPTDDGRIKPDLTAPVYFNFELGKSLMCNQDAYTSGFNGTSSAAPVVSGVYALLYELQGKLFSSKFLSSTYRAILNHTAFEVGKNDGPDYESGWGLLNAYGAVSLVDWLSRSDALSEMEISTANPSFSTTITAKNSVDPIKVSLAWTDPASVSCNSPVCDQPELVNNLDLIVEDSKGVRYYPWTLDPSIRAMTSLPKKFHLRSSSATLM